MRAWISAALGFLRHFDLARCARACSSRVPLALDHAATRTGAAALAHAAGPVPSWPQLRRDSCGTWVPSHFHRHWCARRRGSCGACARRRIRLCMIADSPGFLRLSGTFGISAGIGLRGSDRYGAARARITRQGSLNHVALTLCSVGPWDRGNLCQPGASGDGRRDDMRWQPGIGAAVSGGQARLRGCIDGVGQDGVRFTRPNATPWRISGAFIRHADAFLRQHTPRAAASERRARNARTDDSARGREPTRSQVITFGPCCVGTGPPGGLPRKPVTMGAERSPSHAPA